MVRVGRVRMHHRGSSSKTAVETDVGGASLAQQSRNVAQFGACCRAPNDRPGHTTGYVFVLQNIREKIAERVNEYSFSESMHDPPGYVFPGVESKKHGRTPFCTSISRPGGWFQKKKIRGGNPGVSGTQALPVWQSFKNDEPDIIPTRSVCVSPKGPS